MYAFCWRSGVINFGKKVPEGALEIGNGVGKKFKEFISVKGRLAYDGETYLVPGVPEAKSDKDALDAFIKWLDWLAACHQKTNKPYIEYILSEELCSERHCH